jgi:hypothetical protein
LSRSHIFGDLCERSDEEGVKALSMRRVMMKKQFPLLGLLLAAGVSLLLLTLVHLEGEIARLDEARDRLGRLHDHPVINYSTMIA